MASHLFLRFPLEEGDTQSSYSAKWVESPRLTVPEVNKVSGNPEFCEVARCQDCSVQGSSTFVVCCLVPCCLFYMMHSLFSPGWDFVAAICLIYDIYLYCVENESNTHKNYLRELWWQIFTLRCFLRSWSSSSLIPTFCSDHVACMILAL